MSHRTFALDGFSDRRRPFLTWEVRRLRSLLSRWDVLGIGALALAWLILVAWTAVGSASWQARVCADLTHQPRGCEAIEAKKDESRIAPAAAAS